MDLIESTLVSAAMEFDDAEVESSYEKTCEATAKVLEPRTQLGSRYVTLERVLLPLRL